jgi:hypothetical protein
MVGLMLSLCALELAQTLACQQRNQSRNT